MLRQLNQTVNLYINYGQNDYGDVDALMPISLEARVGVTEITEIDSQGNNVYPAIDLHTETECEIQKGMCIEYLDKTYEIRTVKKTYNRAGSEFFYYIKAIQKDFNL